MPAIDILMATYNGERFIVEQIESMLSQTFTDWRLIIRDDGSSDNTPAIIEDYAAKYPGKIQVIHDDAVCRSATKNFFELLKHAEADYVMFSDQDDVWLKWKVEITYDYMKNAERDNPGKPVMVFTGMQAVDAELRSLDAILRLNYPERRYTFRELLTGNCASGCTQMINRKCYEGIGGFEEGIKWHDWWAGLYASAFGAVVRVPMSLILYRQHSDNVSGSALGEQRSIMCRLYRLICGPLRKFHDGKTYGKEIFAERYGTINVFRSRYKERISPEQLHDIDENLLLYSRHIFTRIKAMMGLKNTDYFTKIDIASRTWMLLFSHE